MNFKKETQFTNNASKRVFEEVYTNDDLDNNKTSDSYRLTVPQMFANNPSQEKAISPRRVMCEPKPHIFTAGVEYESSDGQKLRTPNIRFDFTSTNNFEEIINDIVDKTIYDENNEMFKLMYSFNKLNGMLMIVAEDKYFAPVKFRFYCPYYDDYMELWSLFNQTNRPFYSEEENIDNYDELTTPLVDSYQLPNVWSREPLYVHASFSNSKKHYLCRTGDFWFKPSKYYYDNTNQNDFQIFFTTDGIHKIVPHDAVKIIELCFILRQFARL